MPNLALKPEVTFCVQGVMTPPCGVPRFVRRASVVCTQCPSMTSTTGAVSQPLMVKHTPIGDAAGQAPHQGRMRN